MLSINGPSRTSASALLLGGRRVMVAAAVLVLVALRGFDELDVELDRVAVELHS